VTRKGRTIPNLSPTPTKAPARYRATTFGLLTLFLAACDGDTRTVYEIAESDNEWGLPLGLNPSVFRISGENIIKKIGSTIFTHEDCDVWDLDNWSCVEDDGDYFFGFANGKYFEVTPNEYGKIVTKLEWKINKCKWWAKDGGFGKYVMCPIVIVFAK
jgi:hypothetical protein